MALDVDIVVGTFNVNGRIFLPAKQTLAPWLVPGEEQKARALPPDVVALGFQEFTEDIPTDPAIQKQVLSQWIDAAKECLGIGASSGDVKILDKRCDYVLVESVILEGIVLVLLASSSIAARIRDVAAAVVGTGPLFIGSKGAVGIRFDMSVVVDSPSLITSSSPSTTKLSKSSSSSSSSSLTATATATSSCSISLCFVNAHLPAHTHNFAVRNQDVRLIEQRMIFEKSSRITLSTPSSSSSPSFSSSSSSSSSSPPSPPTRDFWHMYDHHAVFFFGDLNYRIDGVPHQTVVQLAPILSAHAPVLHNGDQLQRAMTSGLAFSGFSEAKWPIPFLPSYKYDPGTLDRFDSSKKNRTPSWCDRVLHTLVKSEIGLGASHDAIGSDDDHAGRGGNPQQQLQLKLDTRCYQSAPTIKFSDHKPVAAMYKLSLHRIDAKGSNAASSPSSSSSSSPSSPSSLSSNHPLHRKDVDSMWRYKRLIGGASGHLLGMSIRIARRQPIAVFFVLSIALVFLIHRYGLLSLQLPLWPSWGK